MELKKRIQQIVLIDDDPVINFIHSKVIQSSFPGIQIVIFTNGFTALEHIRAYPTNSYLIFLDLNMPEIDGWEFLEKISSEDRELDLKVHIVTSSVDPSDKIKAQKNDQVSSFLLKPLKSHDLESLPNY